jgi:hypothetical protein
VTLCPNQAGHVCVCPPMKLGAWCVGSSDTASHAWLAMFPACCTACTPQLALKLVLLPISVAVAEAVTFLQHMHVMWVMHQRLVGSPVGCNRHVHGVLKCTGKMALVGVS